MAPRAVGRPPGPLRGVLGVSGGGRPKKAAPLGLLGERLVSEASREIPARVGPAYAADRDQAERLMREMACREMGLLAYRHIRACS